MSAQRAASSRPTADTGPRAARQDGGADMPSIAVVDYGMGNRRSVEKALERVGASAFVSRDHAELRAADGLLRERAAAGTPLFGSCMGMQLLFERSEEHGGAEGLGLLRGEVRTLRAPDLKLPHIGWSEVQWRWRTALNEGLPDPAFLYHVHSFIAYPADPEVVLGTAEYGEIFPAVVEQANIYGAQSHPEKSSTHGLRLLGNFVGICAAAVDARMPTQPSGLGAPS